MNREAALTAETITDEQIRELRAELVDVSPRFNDEVWNIRSATHALGFSVWFEGIDCRIPLGMEATYIRRARARCAEIINARTKEPK